MVANLDDAQSRPMPPDQRATLQQAAALTGTSSAAATAARTPSAAALHANVRDVRDAPQIDALRTGMIGYMLAHEQFPVPELVELGAAASQAGFDLLATSDHFQPWQANEAHCGLAWVTLGALGAKAQRSWMGTTVTCPTLRYHPAVVAEAFAK